MICKVHSRREKIIFLLISLDQNQSVIKAEKVFPQPDQVGRIILRQ